MLSRIFLSILFFIICSQSISGTYTGKVEQINLHGNSWQTYNPNDLGILSLHLVDMPKSCGREDGIGRVVITSDHPLFQNVLSIALAAELADRNVTISYLDTCKTRDKAWDFGYISFGD